MQCVAPKELENYEDEVLKLSTGCAVIVSGELVASQGGGSPLKFKHPVELIGGIDDPESYPLQKASHLRVPSHPSSSAHANQYLWCGNPRTTYFGQRHTDFFHSEDFYWVNTPIITASDCEGAGELFRVSTLDLTNLPRDDKGQVDTSQDFFGSDAYLTVSGQLAVESYCLSMSKVYTFGPTFRAENSNTSRHLAEFWMVEPEVAFADLADNAALAERLLKSVTQRVLNDCENDLGFFQQRIDNTVLERLTNIVDQPFVRVTYSDAIDILLKSGKKFEFPVEWGIDMASEHERFLSETHFKAPVVVTDYPRDIKAFYMRLNDDERTVAAMDVLAPGIGEIIGGSQREERLDVLDARMDEVLKDTLWWYRDLRRYGTVPHAGFGLGFERLVAYITGMENVRDVIPFPRTPGNAEF